MIREVLSRAQARMRALAVPVVVAVADPPSRTGALYVDQLTGRLALRRNGVVTKLGNMLSTSNLSDVASVRTALQNLGAPLPTLSSIGTWTLDEDGSHLRQASGGSAFSHKAQYITAPATPWTLAAEIRYSIGNDATAGLWCRRSSNGKILTFSFRADGTCHVYRWDSTTAFSADAGSTAIPSIPGNRVVAVSSDGTTLSFYHLTGVGLAGGTLPTATATEAIATHLGGNPDEIGVYSDSYNNETQISLLRMRSY